MTREVIRYETLPHLGCGFFKFLGRKTSLGCNVTAFPSSDRPNMVFVMMSKGAYNHRFFYVANRNVIAVLHADTPPGVFIDSLIESSDNEWHASDEDRESIPWARQVIEALALMDMIPKQGA